MSNRMLSVRRIRNDYLISAFDRYRLSSRCFVEALDQREDIKLFIKLPRWFTVDTPIGAYNPDWAIVKQEDDGEEKLYLVTETKATKEELKLRAGEWKKIQCGKAHFDALDVKFKHAVSPEEV